MIAVFDTNIMIDALNGVEVADAEYGRYDRVLISVNTKDFDPAWGDIRVPYAI